MALETQVVAIALAQGIDTKTDPKQLPIGKLDSLSNGIFTTGKELNKRNGFGVLNKTVVGHSAITAGSALAAYNDEITMCDGSEFYSYSPTRGSWLDINRSQAADLSVNEVYRDLYQQTLCDSAINGTYQCNVWHSSNSSAPVQYNVVDLQTGVIVWSDSYGSTTTKARVFSLDKYFVILSYNSSGTHLNYTSLDTTSGFSGSTVSINTDISSTVPTFDGIVINNKLFIVYNNTAANISLYSLSSGLVLSAQVNEGAEHLFGLGLASDASNNLWVFYSTAAKVRGFVMNASLVQQLAPTDIVTLSSVIHITAYVTGTTGHVFFDKVIQDTQSFIEAATLTLAGSAGGGLTIKSVSLYSKGFTYGGVFYFWAQFTDNEQIQQTYFLIDENGYVVAKLAQGNGASADNLNYFLANVNTTSAGAYQVNYLIKDRLDSTNGNVFSTTGVNSCQILMSKTGLAKINAGNNLLLAGSEVNMYDGKNFVEFGFHYFPDVSITGPIVTNNAGAVGPGSSTATPSQFQYVATYEWMDNQGQIHRSAPSVPTTLVIPNGAVIYSNGTFTNGNKHITGISSTAGMVVGQYISIRAVGVNVTNSVLTSVVSATAIDDSNNFSGLTAAYDFIVTNAPILMFPNVCGTTLNSTTVTTADTTGLAVGQTIQEFKNTGLHFPAGTTITSITTNTSFTTSEPATVTDVVAIFFTFDIYSVQITVPTLRLTLKSGVTIILYRTQLNQEIFYRVSSITSPTFNSTGSDSVVITDTVSDAVLVGNDQLYITGGEVENIAPPASFASATFKTRGILVPSENKLQWWYSKQVIPGSPLEFNDSFVQNVDPQGGNIVAVAALDEKLVIFKQRNIFYVVGDGPSPSGANNDFTEAQLVSSDFGCRNPNSVILLPQGLMFQSLKGIYLLDRGLNPQYIGADVEAYNAYDVSSVHAIPHTTMVRLTLTNGLSLMYDWFYNQWDTDANLTTAIDSMVQGNLYYYLDAAGLVYQESVGAYTDNAQYFNMSLETGWLNFDQIQGFQRVKQLLIIGQYKSPHDLVVSISTDFSATPNQVVTIPVQSDPGIYQFRIFITQQKCETLKIAITDSNQSGSGQSFSISALTLEVGVKKGLNKLTAAQTAG